MSIKFLCIHHNLESFVKFLCVYLNHLPSADWIVSLGPQTSYDDAKCAPCYEYSIVSDEFGLSLWVLARNPADFFDNYNPEVSQFLITEGKLRILN
jgi:hypothetical protein